MVAYDELIRSTLFDCWHLIAEAIDPLPGAMTARAWDVACAGDRFVVRLLDAEARGPVEAGLVAAERLSAGGFLIGEPVRTLSGTLTADTPAGVLVLQRRVPGRPLDGADPLDQQWWGDVLACAHRALDGFEHRGAAPWHWLRSDAAHLDVEPWVRPAVTDAIAATTRLTVTDRLTYGVLHRDPAPGTFVVDVQTGRTGLLAWGCTGTGPLVYDLAAAVSYAGGPESANDLLEGYAAAGPVSRDEIDAALPVLLRLRLAAQADWHARKLATGGVDAAGHRAALRTARTALTAAADGAA